MGRVSDPERSALVAAYRRLPVGARRMVARQVPPEVRRRVKYRLAGVAAVPGQWERTRVQRAARRNPGLFTAPGRRTVTADRRPRAALVHEDPGPLLARTENLRAVTRALEEAGVDWFCVRGASDRSGTVAVPEPQRRRVLRALARACAEVPGYVSVPAGGGVVMQVPVPGFEAAAWHRVADAAVVRVTWYRTDPSGRLVLGAPYGCDVEFWSEADGRLVAPRRNRVTSGVPAAGATVRAPGSRFTRLAAVGSDTLPEVRTRPEFLARRPDEVDFPIDVVYTWVDGSDPEWLRRRARAAGTAYHEEAANAARYLSRDELRYSLRSLAAYAPWVRRIFLVTDDQVPPWLDTSVPGLRMVAHREIFADPGVLPTFNSHAIESQLHHIDGLAEHFLYFNDDMFLGREVVPQTFFHANGLTKFFPSPANVPPGAPGPEDVPVSVAGKNNRRLIEQRFGTVITQKMKHVPYPLRRSVLYEMEEVFAEQHRATAANRFRSMDDLSVVSSLHHYYAFHTGRAVPGSLRYRYVDLAEDDTAARLDTLLARRDRHCFCLNDTVSTEGDLAAQLALLRPFLEAYFPVPGPYERRPGAGAPPGDRRAPDTAAMPPGGAVPPGGGLESALTGDRPAGR